jgi:hypothetical protein
MTDNLDKTEDRTEGTKRYEKYSLGREERGERLQVSEGILNTCNRPISSIFGWFRYIISVDYLIVATDNSSNCS